MSVPGGKADIAAYQTPARPFYSPVLNPSILPTFLRRLSVILPLGSM